MASFPQVVLSGSRFSKLKGGQEAVIAVLQPHFEYHYEFATSKTGRADAAYVLVPAGAAVDAGKLKTRWPKARVLDIDSFVRKFAKAGGAEGVDFILEELELVYPALGASAGVAAASASGSHPPSTTNKKKKKKQSLRLSLTEAPEERPSVMLSDAAFGNHRKDAALQVLTQNFLDQYRFVVDEKSQAVDIVLVRPVSARTLQARWPSARVIDVEEFVRTTAKPRGAEAVKLILEELGFTSSEDDVEEGKDSDERPLVVLAGSPFTNLEGGQDAAARVLTENFVDRYRFASNKAAHPDAAVVLVPAGTALADVKAARWPKARVVDVVDFVRTATKARGHEVAESILEDLDLAYPAGSAPPEFKTPEARASSGGGARNPSGSRGSTGARSSRGAPPPPPEKKKQQQGPPVPLFVRVAQSGGTKPDGAAAKKRLFLEHTNDAGMRALVRVMGPRYIYEPKPSEGYPPDVIVTPDGSPPSKTKLAVGARITSESLAQFLRAEGRADLIEHFDVKYDV